jgi:predicted amidohydrolase
MRISLLQPKIERGNIRNNIAHIQELIDTSKGELLILPEYAFTGSLNSENNVDIDKWIVEGDVAKKNLKIPVGKILLTNSLVKIDEEVYNCSEFLPEDKKQIKVFPDSSEEIHGIKAGKVHETFQMFDKKFKVFICMDFKHWKSVETEDVDFVLFIYHFTNENYEKRIIELKKFVSERKIPVLASSLVSDKNNGFSTYINENTIISIPELEGILEIEI